MGFDKMKRKEKQDLRKMEEKFIFKKKARKNALTSKARQREAREWLKNF